MNDETMTTSTAEPAAEKQTQPPIPPCCILSLFFYISISCLSYLFGVSGDSLMSRI